MIPPYKHRLLARYGSDLIELVRFNRPIDVRDIDFWTEGVEHWEHERTLTSKECITSRPVTNQKHVKRPKIKLTPTERDSLRDRGLQPEYKI